MTKSVFANALIHILARIQSSGTTTIANASVPRPQTALMATNGTTRLANASVSNVAALSDSSGTKPAAAVSACH